MSKVSMVKNLTCSQGINVWKEIMILPSIQKTMLQSRGEQATSKRKKDSMNHALPKRVAPHIAIEHLDLRSS